MVRNDSQWTQLITCKLDHLWYASGKIKRIFFSLCFAVFFGPGLSASRTPSDGNICSRATICTCQFDVLLIYYT